MTDNLSYEFDSFRLIPAERQLLRDDLPIALPPKAFDTLVVLVQNSGRVLKKDDLIKQLWPDSFVEESNLNHYISVLRKTLSNGDNGDAYVETVRGYGFRFNGDVRAINQEESSARLVHRHTRTHVVFKEEERESLKRVSIRQTAVGRNTWLRPVTIAALAILIVVGGIASAYFGYIRSIRSRSSKAASVDAPPTRTAENPAAREAYLKGRYYWNKRTADDIWKAAHEFARALEIDPNYAPAYVGMADCLLLGGGGNPAITESPKTLAQKALAIDDNLAEAHATLAYYESAIEWDWSGAELEFQRAISLAPDYVTARHWHAYNLASLGRMDEALSEIRRARDLDPVSVNVSTDVGQMLYFAERYDEAISQYLKALALDPGFRVAHVRLSEAYTQTGKHEEAAAELKEVIRLDPSRESEMDIWLAFAAALNGRREEALKILNRLKMDLEFHSHATEIASIYAGLGDKGSAFTWLEKALNAHEPGAALVKVDPMLKSLRSDPRFEELLRRVNLSSG